MIARVFFGGRRIEAITAVGAVECACGGYAAVSAIPAAGIDIVFGNEDEVATLLETSSHEATMDALVGYENLFSITRSDKGSVTKLGSKIVFQNATPIDNLVDTTGAGDAFNAGFAVALTEKQNIKDAISFASATAGLSTTRIGTANSMPSREEIDKII